MLPGEFQSKMGIGINVGNRIDLWDHDPREIKSSWFSDFKKKGFSNARIPVCWHERTGTTAPYTIDPTFLQTVEDAVDASLDQGLVTILNTHHEKWLDVEADFSAQLPRLLAIWRQLAERFKGKSDLLAFEIFNEPHNINVNQLNEMNTKVLAIIREGNPSRNVFINGLQYGE